MKNNYILRLTELLKERDIIDLELCNLLQDMQELKESVEIKENRLNNLQKQIEEMLDYLKTDSPFSLNQELNKEEFNYRSRIKACKDI